MALSSPMQGIRDDSEPDSIEVARYTNGTYHGPGRVFRNKDRTPYPATMPRRPYDPTTTSTYERLWPGYKRPWWATKHPRFRGFRPPEGHSVCYVHVGKTAGSSIGCALGFNLHCSERQQYLPGRLPKSATNAFHKDVYDCPSTSSFYLFVVRDPLARFRSAFVYGRPDELDLAGEGKSWNWEKIKQLYVDCSFLTASSLASLGLAEDGQATNECKQRAKDLLRGTVRYEDHAFFNYQYYLEAIPHGSNILVIRTEHMDEDWNDIELGLGGRARTNLTFPHDNSKQKGFRDLSLSDEEKKLLCRELCVEIQTYKLLLRKALNIDEEQYELSKNELRESCPNEADLKQCDFHTPNIKQKLVESRGYPHA